LKDGGELALDWLEPKDSSKKVPLVLVLPGLTGNSQAEYIKSLMRAAQSEGFRCVVLNNRGLGGVDLKVRLQILLFSCVLTDKLCRHQEPTALQTVKTWGK
jgi:predicted alpha/beta-fold hydrolase